MICPATSTAVHLPVCLFFLLGVKGGYPCCKTRRRIRKGCTVVPLTLPSLHFLPPTSPPRSPHDNYGQQLLFEGLPSARILFDSCQQEVLGDSYPRKDLQKMPPPVQAWEYGRNPVSSSVEQHLLIFSLNKELLAKYSACSEMSAEEYGMWDAASGKRSADISSYRIIKVCYLDGSDAAKRFLCDEL